MAKQKSMMEYMKSRNSMQLNGGGEDPPNTKKATTLAPGKAGKGPTRAQQKQAEMGRKEFKKKYGYNVNDYQDKSAGGDRVKSTQGTIDEINKMNKEGVISAKERVSMKKQLLGESGFDKKYKPTIGSEVKKAIRNIGKGNRSGLEAGSPKKAVCKSGKCTGHNTDF